MMSRVRDVLANFEEKAGSRRAAVSPIRQRCRIGVSVARRSSPNARVLETARGGGVLPVGAEGVKGAANQTGTLRYCLAWHML